MTFKKTKFVLMSIFLPLIAEANLLQENFCHSPVTQICSGQSSASFQNLQARLRLTALEVLNHKYPKLSFNRDLLNMNSITLENKATVQSEFSAELLKAFEQSLSNQDLLITDSDLKPMKQTISEFAAKYYGDTNLHTVIQDIKIILSQKQYTAFVQTLPEDIRSIKSVATFYDRFCGDLQSQAHFEKSQNFVLVCPGFILKAMADGPKAGQKQLRKSDLIRRLTFVLSHEVSHSLDMNITMGTFYSCLQKNRSFNSAEFDFGKRPEVYADFFAYHQLAYELTQMKTMTEKIELTKQNLQALCTSNTSIDHPSKEFRINALLNYSVISAQLGCAVKPQNQCQ